MIASADRAKRLAEAATPLKEHGVNQHAEVKEEGEGHYHDNVLPKSKQGTDSQYLSARIARDRPDILEKMQAGEFPSVRAAAVAAGVVKDKKTITLSPNPGTVAKAIYKHYGEAQSKALVEAMSKP